MVNFEIDTSKGKVSKFMVIGLGGGGIKIITYISEREISGVDFLACMSNRQDLENCPFNNIVEIGKETLKGEGAGGDLTLGERSTSEALNEIKDYLTEDIKLIFLTAVLGGGTGTGGAPVIAKLARELNILCIAIVTQPDSYQGPELSKKVQQGIKNLKSKVDSLVLINPKQILEYYEDLEVEEGENKVYESLYNIIFSITDFVMNNNNQRISFSNLRQIFQKSGNSIVGTAIASGQNRASEVVNKVLDSPLINYNKIDGAKQVLALLYFGEKGCQTHEIMDIRRCIQKEAGNNVNLLFRFLRSNKLKDEFMLTIFATGFPESRQNEIINLEEKEIVELKDDSTQQSKNENQPQEVVFDFNDFRTPSEVTDQSEEKNPLEDDSSNQNILNYDDTEYQQNETHTESLPQNRNSIESYIPSFNYTKEEYLQLSKEKKLRIAEEFRKRSKSVFNNNNQDLPAHVKYGINVNENKSSFQDSSQMGMSTNNRIKVINKNNYTNPETD